MEVEHAIRTRRTHKAYTSEPVDRATLDELFELARWAPNHNLTNPWRFRVVGPRALEQLKHAAGRESAPKLDRAPTLVVASATQIGDDPVRDQEDMHAAAAAIYILLLAAHARGLAGYWGTPAGGPAHRGGARSRRRARRRAHPRARLPRTPVPGQGAACAATVRRLRNV